MVVGNTFTMMDDLPEGNIDLNMELWHQNYVDWHNQHTEEGNIVNLGRTFEEGPQFFMIPQWVADQYDIETIFDMSGHWDLFMDPEDSTKGIFYSGIIGWEATNINAVKLEAYGLSKHYNPVSPGSEDSLEAVLDMAQERHQPVFAYYWAPTSMMGKYDWHILQEPAYAHECWENITAAVEDESLRPLDEACAYEAIPIDKGVHKSLLTKAPDVVDMLEKMNVGLDPLNQCLAWSDENETQSWEAVTVYFLQNYEERWETWVTPKARDKIKEALQETSS
jgi:glycine betaine/proline transport system substrate-binding protein